MLADLIGKEDESSAGHRSTRDGHSVTAKGEPDGANLVTPVCHNA